MQIDCTHSPYLCTVNGKHPPLGYYLAFVKAYLKENGDMPFWAFEFENEALFNRMLEAHVNAILTYVNNTVIEPGEEPFTEETVSWEYVMPEFYWPDELLGE